MEFYFDFTQACPSSCTVQASLEFECVEVSMCEAWCVGMLVAGVLEEP